MSASRNAKGRGTIAAALGSVKTFPQSRRAGVRCALRATRAAPQNSSFPNVLVQPLERRPGKVVSEDRFAAGALARHGQRAGLAESDAVARPGSRRDDGDRLAGPGIAADGDPE